MDPGADARQRLEELRADWSVPGLVAFHTDHKLLLLAHSPAAYRALGRLVAGAKGRPPAEVETEYVAGFEAALSVPATRGRHVNVLQHIAGYLVSGLDPAGRDELHAAIDAYARGDVPLEAPLSLVRALVSRQRIHYLERQAYLR